MKKGEKPTVSIVMPCYQNEKSLEASVHSVQKQTVPSWELIAVDDGSTDGTGRILQELAVHDARISVLRQTNAGVSAARNAGMDAAQGDWIFFLDADDCMEPDALETLLHLAGEQTDILCGAYCMRDLANGYERVIPCTQGDLHTVWESLLRGDSALNSMCARLYRLDWLREHGIRAPLGIAVGEDVLFNLAAFSTARGWTMTDRVVYTYLFGGDSAMHRAQTDLYARSLPMLQAIDAFLLKEDAQTTLFRAHIDAYLRTLRADRGRWRAALAFGDASRAVTRDVEVRQLSWKERLYWTALRIAPISSALLP